MLLLAQEPAPQLCSSRIRYYIQSRRWGGWGILARLAPNCSAQSEGEQRCMRKIKSRSALWWVCGPMMPWRRVWHTARLGREGRYYDITYDTAERCRRTCTRSRRARSNDARRNLTCRISLLRWNFALIDLIDDQISHCFFGIHHTHPLHPRPKKTFLSPYRHIIVLFDFQRLLKLKYYFAKLFHKFI